MSDKPVLGELVHIIDTCGSSVWSGVRNWYDIETTDVLLVIEANVKPPGAFHYYNGDRWAKCLCKNSVDYALYSGIKRLEHRL